MIPSEFETFVIKITPDPFFSESDSNRFVCYLYPTKTITADQLIQLVEAQEFSSQIWQSCSLKEQTSGGPDWEFPKIAASDWPSFLRTQSVARVNNLASIVTRSICEECEKHKKKPIILSVLKDFFGPDETEEKRIYFRGRLQSDLGWSLKYNDQGWEQNLFQFVSDNDLNFLKLDTVALKNQFRKSLEKAIDFATKMESPFSEAFKLSLFFLDHQGESPSNLDQVKAAGFSSRALEVASRELGILADCQHFFWSTEKLQGIIAISVCDVFGGMGSWNDQYFEGDSQKEYEAISAELFKFMKNYFLSLMSISRSH